MRVSMICYIVSLIAVLAILIMNAFRHKATRQAEDCSDVVEKQHFRQKEHNLTKYMTLVFVAMVGALVAMFVAYLEEQGIVDRLLLQFASFLAGN